MRLFLVVDQVSVSTQFLGRDKLVSELRLFVVIARGARLRWNFGYGSEKPHLHKQRSAETYMIFFLCRVGRFNYLIYYQSKHFRISRDSTSEIFFSFVSRLDSSLPLWMCVLTCAFDGSCLVVCILLFELIIFVYNLFGMLYKIMSW